MQSEDFCIEVIFTQINFYINLVIQPTNLYCCVYTREICLHTAFSNLWKINYLFLTFLFNINEFRYFDVLVINKNLIEPSSVTIIEVFNCGFTIILQF